jgi:hypothetical protein
MSIFNTKYEIRNTRNEKGAVLLFTLIVMIVLISVVGAYLGFVQSSTRSTGAQIEDSQAIYLADAGLQYAIHRLTDSDYRDNVSRDVNNTTTGSANLGEGSYTFEIYRGALEAADEDTFYITSTGTLGGLGRQITQTALETSAVLERAIHADGAHLKLNYSSGTINGNVSCFVSVQPDPLPGGLTITGTVTDQDDDQAKVNPLVNLGVGTTYYNLADALGQRVAGNKTFNSNGSPYTGIWYMGGWVRIESNVTINGSIIAEGSITFENSADNVVINPMAYEPTQNYPALVSGSDISSTGVGNPKIGLQNSTINGLVMAEQNITFDYLLNTTFNGTILAGQNVDMQYGSGFIVNFNEDIFTPMPPGFTYTAGGETTLIPQKDWDEI